MKKGSALLVVLGMLSFMVVSAVAFSIYMRQNRLPSSFLRQNILSRQLVKAGLAQAMSELDAAIGDAKYPGHEFGNESNKNYWRNRVYMGVSGDGYQDNEENEHLKNTVSTFPLEGLAYIPPPLVNTVRYWARRSPSATWKNLEYDSGRYAFTAVNVSDYLDINRLRANVMRDSSPSNRLSLAFLFENDNHSGWGSCSPSKFDEAMDALNSSVYGRLVSMADYNLALSSDASGPLAQSGFTSPFCEFIKSPPSGAEFYVDEEQAKIQKFVTDSWYPGGEITDLVLSDHEAPLYRNTGTGIRDLPEGIFSLMKDGASPIFNKVKQYLNLAERAALRDYVDDDNVPSSLALPTLERAPMLTGLMIKAMGFKPKIEELPVQGPEMDKPQAGQRMTTRVWKLTGFDNPSAVAQCSGVFPFKRTSKRKSDLPERTDYDVQVLVKAYLVADDRSFDTVRVPSDDTCAYRPTGTGDWKADNLLGASDRGYLSLVGNGTATVKFGKTEQDTLIDIPNINLQSSGATAFERPIFGWQTVEEKDENENWSTVSETFNTDRFPQVGGGSLYYLDNTGKPVAVAAENLKLKWQFFAWVRIIGDDNATVDMFPATVRDDVAYNDINSDAQSIATQLGIDASRDPVVPFAGPMAFDLSKTVFLGTTAGVANGSDQPSETLCCYCSDPRFNWAPEDWWFVSDGTGVKASEWFSKTQTYRDGTDYRQHDIFQFVSNQGYLQSMGELQFLPLVRRDYNDFTEGNAIQGGIFRNGGQYDGVRRTDVGNAANQDFMWRTRCGFGEYADWDKGGDRQDPYNWGIVDRRGGAAVNPYADEDLFMAALANTPYDYIVAAEVEKSGGKGGNTSSKSSLEDNIDLCFNARSSEARIDWETLREIARKMREKFIASGQSSAPGGNGQNTETANDSFGWEEWDEWEKGKGGDFFETLGDEIHDVDRKFLFSYWKPCFANSQQLFLVFVRAEPTVIGGSSAGHTPSQLGARAVALVWREPVSTVAGSQGQGGNATSTGSVHRMRILFYHQFE